MGEINFGTGGFRGVIGVDFTKENVQKICQAMSNIAKEKNYKKEICIGFDNRFMSEDYARWCAEVFAGNGFKVELFKNACSTPVVMFASKKKHLNYSIMITASHNPYIYNGIKVFIDGGKDASIEETNLIEDEISKVKSIVSVNFSNEIGNSIIYSDYIDEFIESIIKNQNIPNCNNLKVIFDAKFGSTTEELKLFCKKINIENYTILNSTRDAFFNFSTPAPSIDNIEQLKLNVVNSKADIGFALDADGDRLAVVDSNGNYIDNNYILALVYYYFIKYENMAGDSVRNVATSNLLDVVSQNLGFRCHEVPVGFKFVSNKLIETNSIIGGESSGGLAVQNHIWGKDSLLAIALILKIMATLKRPFNEILNELLAFADNYSKIIMDKQYTYSKAQEIDIKNAIFKDKKLPKHRYELRDIFYGNYLKIYYKNGNWVLIRFSGTEPVFRVFVEADSEDECRVLIKDWEKLLGFGK